MAKGGSRTRSGPPKDPNSGRSERTGFKPTALPNEGYAGRVPGLNQFVPKPTARHRATWDELWSTPQACMWSKERYKWPIVARLTALRVRAEGECPATIYGEILKLETKLGLNDEGMRYLGWAIAADEVKEQAAKKTAARPAKKTAPTRRLRSVGGRSTG